MTNLQMIKGVACFIDDDGVAQLKLENVARGLGFTRVATSGNEVIRWERVERYLTECGVPTSGHGDEHPEFIPEPIFYLLCMKAENDTAKAFQQMVAYEILPAIRKHGMYAVDQLLDDPELAIKAFTALKEERAKNFMLVEKVEQYKPKVLFADAVSASESSIAVGDLATLIKQNGVDIGRTRLFTWLRDNGYIIKQKGIEHNAPTQRSLDMGLLEIKENSVVHSSGFISIEKTPRVTGKGQQYFINKFLQKKEQSK